MSQGFIKKQQQHESSLEKSLPPRKYITRRPQISKIIKVQGDLPSGRNTEGYNNSPRLRRSQPTSTSRSNDWW